MKEAAVDLRSVGGHVVPPMPVPPAGLAIVRGLLSDLDAAGLRYCHWKSNEHLDAAVLGATDLDVLFDPRRTDDLNAVLARNGFRRFQANALTAYPAIEDYLGVDDATGTLVHLHAHFRLTLGQKQLKGYRLPWEAAVLDTRRHDPVHGAWTASPEMELLLLIVRDALKWRLRSGAKALLGRSGAGGDTAREFEWLRDRADPDAVVRAARDLIGDDAARPVRRLLDEGLTDGARRAVRRVVRRDLARHRTWGPATAFALAGTREAVWILGGLSKRVFRWALPLRRVSPRGGLAVAFLGPDGAGKSTACTDTVGWLGQKLDVVPVYFGSGDGAASVLRMPLILARRLVDGTSGRTRTAAERRSGGRGRLRELALIPWALSLAAEKRAKLRRMVRARNRGMIVICDRFAQAQVAGMNDGPLLSHLDASPSRTLRALAAWERAAYDEAARTPPDLVLKLIPSAAVAHARRPEMERAELEDRIATVRALSFPPDTVVREIDADRPLDTVLLDVRRTVWTML